MPNVTVADQRSLIGVTAALSWQPVDGDGIATTAGTVTVDVSRANGTALITAGATGGATSAPHTYTLAATHTALTDVLTVVWKDDATERARTTVELVGGYFASIAEIRSDDATLSDTSKYPNPDLIRARTEVEQAFSSLTSCDFAPRFHRERLDGSGCSTLVLGWGPLRSVRSVTTYSGTTGTAWTAAQLAAIPADDGRLAVCTDGTVWPRGTSNVVVEYEAGHNLMPGDLKDQFLIEVRKQLNDTNSVAQIATAYNYDSDATADPVLAAQVRRLFSTLMRYSLKIPGIA